ncbi:MAG: hypothetical protein LUQ50_07190 [Methanospirillum sp.]|nr:hypothetical protein [Methanospirillum sp.]
MKILSVTRSIVLSDGQVRTEYRLSSPVTSEILHALSKGNHIFTGYQYLSPTYLISKSDMITISGILGSPIIAVQSKPGMSVGIEDYLSEFLSTIPDSEKPDTLVELVVEYVKPFVRRFINK